MVFTIFAFLFVKKINRREAGTEILMRLSEQSSELVRVTLFSFLFNKDSQNFKNHLRIMYTLYRKH